MALCKNVYWHYVSISGHLYTFLAAARDALLRTCLPSPRPSFHTVFSLGCVSTGSVSRLLIHCLSPSPAWGCLKGKHFIYCCIPAPRKLPDIHQALSKYLWNDLRATCPVYMCFNIFLFRSTLCIYIFSFLF